MEQASVEREKAVKAIKEADGDLINASESRSTLWS
jgi:NACalpha-BTF3-like transcription factor